MQIGLLELSPTGDGVNPLISSISGTEQSNFMHFLRTEKNTTPVFRIQCSLYHTVYSWIWKIPRRKALAILSEEKQDPQQFSEKKYDTNEKEAISPCLVRIAE